MANMIQVILARDIRNLGRVGEVVRVRPGYLRNFLMPKRMALPLSKERLEHVEHQKQLIQHQIAKLKASSESVRDRLEVQKFTIEVKAGEQGKLFGSVGVRDIEAALAKQGYPIDHRDIKLEAPLKTIGLHLVPARLEGDVRVNLNIVLVAQEEPQEEAVATSAEEASLPSEEETPELAE
jgi:large subunit ribosomal protein L9